MKWSNKQGRYGVEISEQALAQMLRYCKAAGQNEVGGILIGRYDEPHTTALITRVTGPTSDSKQGPYWFRRGVQGLKSLLEDLWSTEKTYYLGEWHFHPFATSQASGTDLASLRSIASNTRYACPEPLLMILGGDPSRRWNLTVNVLDKSSRIQRLIKSD